MAMTVQEFLVENKALTEGEKKLNIVVDTGNARNYDNVVFAGVKEVDGENVFFIDTGYKEEKMTFQQLEQLMESLSEENKKLEIYIETYNQHTSEEITGWGVIELRNKSKTFLIDTTFS